VMDKVLVTTSSFSEDRAASLRDAGLQVITNPFGRKLTEHEVKELIEDHQPVGIIAGVEPMTREVMGKAMNLKVISRCGTGMDSVDLEAAHDREIAVTNTPDAPTIPVAELTLGMILTLLRRIHISDMSIRKGLWERPMGGLVYGKVVGIIGCGRIGSYLAKLLSNFGCRILGCDTGCGNDGFVNYVNKASLEDLLQESDIVTLHLPYTEETHHLINETRINRMKQDAVLVNVARGGLVDEAALYKALKSGHLSGAALDCFEKEPYTGPLKDLDNVLVTAHIGSYAREGRILMEEQAVNNLLQSLKECGVIA